MAQSSGQKCLCLFFRILANILFTVSLLTILVSCSSGKDDPAAPHFTISGTVSELTGSGLVLQNNAGDDLSISANGAFTFATSSTSGTSYSVTVKTQPTLPSQTCTVSNGSGTVASSDVTNVTVVCTTNSYSVGGTVSGLAGRGLLLQNNTGDDLSISANGTFTFATSLTSGSTYTVTVKTQPTILSQTCTVSSGSGTVAAGNVDNVLVNCASPPPRFAYVANQVSGSFSAYTINASTGFLTPVAGSPFTAILGEAYFVTVDPSGKFLYSAGGHISVYTIDQSSGALTAGTLAAAELGNGSIAFDQSGKFLYAAGANNITVYNIDQATGTLTMRATAATGIYHQSLAVHPSGKFVYVANWDYNTISVYTIDQITGSMTEGIAVPAGVSPSAVTVDPTGKFVYVANCNSYNVSVYTINQTTGALTAGESAPAGSGPVSVAVDPSGKFVYVANQGSDNISVYTINQTTGALTAGTKVPANRLPTSITVDPSGKFVYVANQLSHNIWVYTINQTTGALNAVESVPCGYQPTSVTTTAGIQ